ncbi:MAG TPA: class I SAM-dependent methyltransferase [Thermoanaerobaculia bacterium]|nr:class I SAM-dependent methyltransferase [Thermoanaerobaculia bacterium]
MNSNEFRFFSESEKRFPDCTSLPIGLLIKSLFVKARRRSWGRLADRNARLVWTTSAVSDAEGPTANVRNYLDHCTIRNILTDVAGGRKLSRACELGCGYGRVIMVLKEFADYVTGFEREQVLVDVASGLLPEITFQRVDSLATVQDEPYDLAMICTVLQHLTDDEARRVCEALKSLARRGHVLIIEKTEPFRITTNIEQGSQFISRDRSVQTYEDYMRPFRLVRTYERHVEPSYGNPSPGTCMLFQSPDSSNA